MEIQLKPYFAFCAEHSDVLRRLFDEREGMGEASLIAAIRVQAPGKDAERVLVDMRDRWRLIEQREDDATRFRLTGANRRYLAGLLKRDDLIAPGQIHAAVMDMRRRMNHAQEAVANPNLSDAVGEMIEIAAMLSEMRADTGRLREAVLNRVGEVRTGHQPGMRIFPVITDLWENYCRPLMHMVSDVGDIDRTLGGMEVDLTVIIESATPGSEIADVAHDLRSDVVATRRRALADFQTAYREVLPLYESGKRTLRVSQGAEILIERLRRHGITGIPFATLIPVGGFRFNGPFRDEIAENAIVTALTYRERAPVQMLQDTQQVKIPFDRRTAYKAVSDLLPTKDLMASIISISERGELADILSVYGGLMQQHKHPWRQTGRQSYAHAGRAFDAPIIAMERAA